LSGTLPLSSSDFVLSKQSAGISSQTINLGLTAPNPGTSPVTVTIANIPTGSSVNGGTENANGSWTVATEDVTSLTLTAAIAYAGAIVLGVTESWANADGSIGSAVLTDNVDVYAPGSPVIALPGDNYLTGGAGNDLFVVSQPIGHDTIYN